VTDKVEDIRLSSYEEWLEHELVHRQHCEKSSPQLVVNLDSTVEISEKVRADFAASFPHSVILEGYDPYLDFAARWLWSNVSERDGRCQEYVVEYPACPLWIATRVWKPFMYKDADGVVKWDEAEEYSSPGTHSHEGKWTSYCLTKTGYDCFMMEYFFKDATDMARFVDAIPSFRDKDNFYKDKNERKSS